MNLRERAIVNLRIAGYDGNRRLWTYIAQQNSIGNTVAQHAWTAGRRLRAIVDASNERETDHGNRMQTV